MIHTQTNDMSSQDPLVSVCMLAYNIESFIGEAIEGVLHQQTTFPVELVIGYDSIPATWDEFLTMCGKLKAAGITPYLEPKDGLGNAVEGWIGAGGGYRCHSSSRSSVWRSWC